MTTKYIEGDIHKVILTLPDNSIDLIYCDPPFNITNSKWDKPLDWKFLFPEMWRVLKPIGKIILYASMPFTYHLMHFERPKYHYTWIKNNSTGFFQSKYQPLRKTEQIFVYYKKRGTYNPQMNGDKIYKKQIKKHTAGEKYFGTRNNIEKSFISETESHKGKYPTNVINFPIRKKRRWNYKNR